MLSIRYDSCKKLFLSLVFSSLQKCDVINFGNLRPFTKYLRNSKQFLGRVLYEIVDEISYFSF